MSENSEEDYFRGLWTNLQTDESYPGLANYVMDKNGELQNNLTELRDSICNDIPPEKCEVLDALIASVCHPPPGCSPGRPTEKGK